MESQIPLGIHDDGSFRFHVPLDLKKGKDGKTWIDGVASVESPDLVGETVILAGMDLSYLLSRGYFNDNHSKTTDGKVGVPTEAAVTPEGLRVRGYLFDTPRAQGIVELADALQKSGSDRRLGLSVEGKTLKRDGKIVKRSWIKDIAITAEPMHPDTFLDVIKSISNDIEVNGYVEDEEETPKEPEPLGYWERMENVILSAFRKIFSRGPEKMSGDLAKMMEAGNQNPPQSGGSALRKESIEEGLTNLDMPGAGGEITEKEAIERLMKERGYSEEKARRLVQMVFNSVMQKFLASVKS